MSTTPDIISMSYGSIRVLCMPLPQASSRREAELQAERTLLPGLTIAHDEHGAPHLPGRACHISISHSRTHLAAALCADSPVGIDIETDRPQLRAVGRRVLSEAEMEAYGRDPLGLLRAWTLKEALYKAALTPGIDFRRDIRLPLAGEARARVVLPAGPALHFSIEAWGPLADGYMALVRAADNN